MHHYIYAFSGHFYKKQLSVANALFGNRTNELEVASTMLYQLGSCLCFIKPLYTLSCCVYVSLVVGALCRICTLCRE